MTVVLASHGCAGAARQERAPSQHDLTSVSAILGDAGVVSPDAAAAGSSRRERVEATLTARSEPGEREHLVAELRACPDCGEALLAIASDPNASLAPLAAELLGELRTPEGLEVLSAIVERADPTAPAGKAEDGPDSPSPNDSRKPSTQAIRSWKRAALLGLSRFDTTSTAFALMRVRAEVSAAAETAESPRDHALIDAIDDYLWRMGLTGELGMCSGTASLKFATDRAKGLGTQHPTLLAAADRERRWAILRQAREDSNGDGRVELSLGSDGAPLGDRTQLYLVLGSGEGAPIDDYLGQSGNGRFVAVRKGLCLALLDTIKKTETILPGADLRSATTVIGSVPEGAAVAPRHSPLPRSMSFASDGRSMLYVRPQNGWPRVVLRDLEKGIEASVDPGQGELLGTGFDAACRRVLLYLRSDVRAPDHASRADSTPATRIGMRTAPLQGGRATDAPYEDPPPVDPEALGGLLRSATREEASAGVVGGPLHWTKPARITRAAPR